MAIAPRRSPRRPWAALTVLAILITGLAWVLYLRVTDQAMRDPFGFYKPEASQLVASSSLGASRRPQGPAEGEVRVWTSARPVEAYARVSGDDLFDRRTGNPTYIDVPEKLADEQGLMQRYDEIIGRVMKRPKSVGFPFTEKEFLPKGTRPGLAGGTPAGKRSMRVNVELVAGIIGLNGGDRFDILSAETMEPPPAIAEAARRSGAPRDSAGLGLYGDLVPRPGDTSLAVDAPAISAAAQAKVTAIVQGGIVVSGLETRLVPTSSASLTAGQITGTRPVQEMVIALAPEEVAPLLAAFRMKADLMCIARSSRPEDNQESVTPGLEPDFTPQHGDMLPDAPTPFAKPSARVVEKIVGGVRTLVAVPVHRKEPDSDAGGDGQ